MENSTATDTSASRRPTLLTRHKMMVMKDIRAKWSHFSEQDVAALKGKAELVTQVAAKYGLEQAQAQRDVDAAAQGPPVRRRRLGQQRALRRALLQPRVIFHPRQKRSA